MSLPRNSDIKIAIRTKYSEEFNGLIVETGDENRVFWTKLVFSRRKKNKKRQSSDWNIYLFLADNKKQKCTTFENYA